MAIKIQGDVVIYDDKTFQVASANTSSRPASPEAGMLRFNTDDNTFEGYDGAEWGSIGGGDLIASTSFPSEGFTLTNSDKGKYYHMTGSNKTVTLPASSDISAGWYVFLSVDKNAVYRLDITTASGDSWYNGEISTYSIYSGNTVLVIYRGNGEWGLIGNDYYMATSAYGSGSRPTSYGARAVAIGASATASGNYTYAFGKDAYATGLYATAMTRSYAGAASAFAAAIDTNSSSYGATGANSIAIGQQAKAPTDNSIAIGTLADATNGAVAIGYNSYTTAVRGVAVGYDTHSGYQAASFGYGLAATGNFSLTLGHSNTASHINSAAIGYGVQTTASYQVALGGSQQTVRISEAYTLPSTDGANNQVLATNGAGEVTFADVNSLVSGLPELYAENPSSPTAPSATGANAVAIGSGAVSSGLQDSIAIGSSTSATSIASIALGTGATASGDSGGFAGQTALGNNAVAYDATGSSTDQVALTRSYASGQSAFAAAIANNTSSYGATGANSVAIGYQAKATGNYSTAIGDTAQATGLNSICIGDAVASGRGTAVIDGEGSSTHSGLRGVTIGYSSSGTADYSNVFGRDASDQGIKSRFAFSGSSFNNDGESQQGMFPLRLATTDATPAALTTDGGSASTDNQIILPNNSAYAFHGTIVARQQASAGTDSAAWKIEGLIRREGSAGTTVLVNSATTVLDNTPSWGMALSADTTNGGLAITVTGAAATNIRWVATVHTSEVTYA